MKLDTTDTIVLTVGIIATLIAVINAALWLRVLIQLYREDTGFDLPATCQRPTSTARTRKAAHTARKEVTSE